MTIPARKLFPSLLLLAECTWLLASGILPSFTWLAILGLAVLPGLGLLLCWRPQQLCLTEWILFAVMLSLLLVMGGGLISNTLLPLVGIVRPLDRPAVLPIVGLLLTLPVLGAWYRQKDSEYTIPFHKPAGRWLTLAIGFGVWPLVAAAGAFELNNGGRGILACLGLVGIAGAGSLLAWYHHRIPTWFWAWSVFCLALSLLWATSLRGWHVTGHDIQLEYYVFKLTSQAGIWDMAYFRDAYNACLSLTILPTFLQSATGITGLVLLKVGYPVILALGATGVLTLSRRFTSTPIAFVATLGYITFPTFLQDMPMLARQEVAFTYFIMLLLVFFDSTQPRSIRRWLIVAATVGMVLSHYSTTFVAVGLLGGAWAVGRLIKLLPLHRPLQKHAAVPPAITLSAVLLLLGLCVIWTGVITKTGGNISTTAVRAAQNLGSLLKPASGESAAYSVVRAAVLPPDVLLAQYAQQQQLSAQRTALAQGGFYAHVPPLKSALLPPQSLTHVGKIVEGWGISPQALANTAKQSYALTLQALILIGIGLCMRPARMRFHPDFARLAPVGFLLLIVQVLIPVIDYGLYRMLQQEMAFLAVPIVLAALALLKWIRVTSFRVRLTIIAAGFGLSLLSISGAVWQATGGTSPEVAVANAGFYFDAYYTQDQDTALYHWFADNYPKGYPVNTDTFTRSQLRATTGLVAVDGLAPSQLTRQDYVLTREPSGDEIIPTYWQGQLLYYQAPSAFLDDAKDEVYSSGHDRVYR